MVRAQPGGIGVEDLLSEMSLLVGVYCSLPLNPVLLQTRKVNFLGLLDQKKKKATCCSSKVIEGLKYP